MIEELGGEFWQENLFSKWEFVPIKLWNETFRENGNTFWHLYVAISSWIMKIEQTCARKS